MHSCGPTIDIRLRYEKSVFRNTCRLLSYNQKVRIQRRAINTIREQEVPQNVSLDGQDTRDKERDLPLNNMQSNFERLWSKFIEKKRMEELRQHEINRRALPLPDYVPPLRRALPDTQSVPRYLQSTYSARKKMLDVPSAIGRAQPTVFNNNSYSNHTYNKTTSPTGRPKSRSPIDNLYTGETRRTLVTCATASSAAKQRPPVRLRQQQQLSQKISGIVNNNNSVANSSSSRSRSCHSLTSHNRSSSKKSSTPVGRSTLKPATSDTELSRRSTSPYGGPHVRETTSSSSYPLDYNGYSGPKSYTSSLVCQSSLQPVTLSPRLARRSLTALNRLTQIAQEGRKKLETNIFPSKTSSSSTLRRTGTFTKEDDISTRDVRRSGVPSSSSRQRPASITEPGLWRGSYVK
ncbi:uncharacterized protein LOC111272384 isoform X2 [Varroa jacobsoni]|uniref:uncharacterized protein LOC111272384 isoform X2 n=1 Tax=Varroa jacobsoni TaxID=62625 RepID=UPI000BF77CFB|nr:uncharacterized protein LOC111272384 isoform X2 [Varroa jacobsoni]